jgi:hypothetical protein
MVRCLVNNNLESTLKVDVAAKINALAQNLPQETLKTTTDLSLVFSENW